MEGTDFIGYRVGGDEFSVVLKDCDIDMVKILRTESQEWQTVLIAEELRLLYVNRLCQVQRGKRQKLLYDNGTCRRNDVRKQAFVLQN